MHCILQLRAGLVSVLLFERWQGYTLLYDSLMVSNCICTGLLLPSSKRDWLQRSKVVLHEILGGASRALTYRICKMSAYVFVIACLSYVGDVVRLGETNVYE